MLPGQRFIENRIVGALRAWLIVGILLKVTRIRDRFDGFSLVYYSTPWPAIAFGFLLLAAHNYRRARWHPMRRYIAFTLGALFTRIATSWHSAPPVLLKPELRLVHWNVAHPEGRLATCAKWIRERSPDIICLSESEPVDSSNVDRWKAEFPDYQLSSGPFGMLCMVRGEVIGSTGSTLGVDSYSALHRLRVRGREVTIYQVDLIARPYGSRRVPLTNLTNTANDYPGRNMIVVGDFNLPRESWYLDPLRAKFAHAFETVGSGLAETWPIFAPALSIDQVWLGPGWRPIACAQNWPLLSDHRPVVVDFSAAEH